MYYLYRCLNFLSCCPVSFKCASSLSIAVVDPGGDPRVPRIPPFSLAIVALLQLPASFCSYYIDSMIVHVVLMYSINCQRRVQSQWLA